MSGIFKLVQTFSSNLNALNMPWCSKSFKDVASYKVGGYNMKNKTNFTTTMIFYRHVNGLTNYSMWNMWIKDRNIGL